ncbi:hypothetical protein FGO68_gene13710 [Halteria grandinella]|uniref:Cadherin domain-containing protein n=1 Tax=Halteria grandinella TaxID=5974 RepID=A0A8J8P2Y8_HALGN|nr:hypothetical protein FGO68_gene13710 [Halteria grandinella]
MGMKLLESGKFLIVLSRKNTVLQMQLINTESTNAIISDSFTQSSSFNSLVLKAEKNVITLGLSNDLPATKIYRISIDEANQKFNTFEGWCLTYSSWYLIDIFFEQSDTNAISLLYNSQNGIRFGIFYVNNTTLAQQNQINQYGNYKGTFIGKETFLIGFTQRSWDQNQFWVSQYQTSAIMSNIPGQSCYFIDTTSYEIFTFTTISDFIQAGDSSTTLYFTLSRDSISFQDMRLQQLTSISSWCPTIDQAFTFDASNPSTFYVNYGSQTISFGDLLYCGTPPVPTVTEYALKNTNTIPGLALNGMTFDITTELKGGMYKGTVVAKSVLLEAELNYTIVVNMPPFFISTLKPFKLQFGLLSTYSLPTIFYKESNPFTFNLELVSVNSTNTSQTCITLGVALADTSVLVFDDTMKQMKINVSDPGLSETWICDFNYKITLKDIKGAISEQEMKISIIRANVAPEWIYDPPQPFFMHVGETISVVLPQAQDPNGDTITLIDIQQPQFSSLPDPNVFQYTLTPQLIDDIGVFHIIGNLSDEQPIAQYLPFSIDITVFNFAPYFVEALQNQTQFVDEFREYMLPEVSDYESNEFTVTVCLGANIYQCSTTLPGFIEFVSEARVFQFKGRQQDKGNFTIQINLTDEFGNSTFSSFTLRIIDYQISTATQGLTASLINSGPPDFITPLTTSLTIEEGKSEQFKFPQIKDPDGDQFECQVNLGNAASFVTYKDLALAINPIQASDTPFSVNILLKDKNQYAPKSNKYRIQITVTAKQSSNTSSEYYISEKSSEEQSTQGQIKQSQQERSVVRLKLVEVNKMGRAKIKVYAKSTQKMMQLISSQMFSIQMEAAELIEDVPFSIESSSSNELVFLLKFNNPERVSSSQNFDRLIITTRRQIQIITPQYYETLPVGTALSTFIPPQVSELTASKLVLIQKSGDYASYTLVSSNLLLNIFLQAIFILGQLQFWRPLLSLRFTE